MRNTEDVAVGKPIAVRSQSISIVSACNILGRVVTAEKNIIVTTSSLPEGVVRGDKGTRLDREWAAAFSGKITFSTAISNPPAKRGDYGKPL
jgi:hypothetical protein